MESLTQDPHYTQVSHYAFQLQPYITHFGRDRVYALTFEAMKSQPRETMQALYNWLGVDAYLESMDLCSARNVTPEAVRQKRPGRSILDRFRHSSLWTIVGRYCPPTVRKLGVALVEKPVQPKHVDITQVQTYLRKLQRPQTEELARILGREFPEWKTLYRE
jgi:hypothetical protein